MGVMSRHWRLAAVRRLRSNKAPADFIELGLKLSNAADESVEARNTVLTDVLQSLWRLESVNTPRNISC